jgi:hypothetical protein
MRIPYPDDPVRLTVGQYKAFNKRRRAGASKYNVSPDTRERTVDGIIFPSMKQAKRYAELKLLEKQGLIRGLELEPEYEIHIRSCETGQAQKVCSYFADFAYFETANGNGGPRTIRVVEDVKGYQTQMYRLKKKMVKAQYGITIRET